MTVLLKAVIAAVPDGPAIVAAGGLITGAQIASMLTAGADGVVLGTRFLYTPECSYTDDMKSVLVEAGHNATERSVAFDEVNRTAFWPPGLDGRAISNEIMDDFREGLSLDDRLKSYDEGKARGEKERMVIWAGSGVGLVNEIKSASVRIVGVHSTYPNRFAELRPGCGE